ncbi:UDP-N-acetylglucosamine 1-carboxyvinyltransferase [bacterium]|nr:UDP-N-acetylglucosamine 1-carboxyvinyltransferase [bacterium]
MSKFIVKGGNPLFGSVRVGGAKNSSWKIMIAALLADSPSRLLNLPHIADVAFVADLIRNLGGKVESRGERMFVVDPSGINQEAIDANKGEFSRSSVAFLPLLLRQFGQASVPLPGGDKIGKRPLERHFFGLDALGAQVEVKDGQIVATLPGKKFHGATYRFAKNSHTGTETLLMAAVTAEGTTILENAAVEPEVVDLVHFLNEMGGHIRLIRPRTWEIIGVEKLHGCIYKIMPDRNETVTYACAALATRGDVIVENARAADLTAFLSKLDDIGAGYQVGDFGIRFFYYQPLQGTDITTTIHPGFMTDWQPLWATLMTQSQGESNIHETVMQSRFQYVEPLQQMGGNLEIYQPEVIDRDKTYNFNLEDDLPDAKHALHINGPTVFHGGEFVVSDLRAGATLILAALSSPTEVILHNVEQIDRGYEKLDERLCNLGAKITREEE